MPGPKRKSLVWDVFESPVSGRVVCKQCSDSFKYSGNTTTLLNHIKKKHPNVDMEESQSSSSTNESNTSTSTDSSQSHEISQNVCYKYKTANGFVTSIKPKASGSATTKKVLFT